MLFVLKLIRQARCKRGLHLRQENRIPFGADGQHGILPLVGDKVI